MSAAEEAYDRWKARSDAAERVQAFLTDLPTDEVITTGYDDDKVLLASDLRLLVEAIKA